MAATKKSGTAGSAKGKSKSQGTRSRKQTGKTAKSSAGAKKKASGTEARGRQSQRSAGGSQDSSTTTGTPVAEFDRPYLLRAFVRLLAMLLYGVIGYVVLVIVFFLAAVQFAIDFVTSRPNSEIRDFMSRLSAYLTEILDYLSFRRGVEDFPFPHPNARFPGPNKAET